MAMFTVALPLKGNEFQANHNYCFYFNLFFLTVALPLKGNEFQANHNNSRIFLLILKTVALPLKGNEFQANHNLSLSFRPSRILLLYLSKVTNFKQITTMFSIVPRAY